MVRKIIVSIVALAFLQSCIKQDEVNVEGNVSLEEKATPLKVGESFTIDVSYVEAGKVFKQSGVDDKAIQYDFNVNKPDVLSVTSQGVVKALKKGNATVTVGAFGSPTKRVVFNVVETDTSVASIVINDIPDFIVLGIKSTLTTRIKDYKGVIKPTATIETWSSSNSDVISIDNNGQISALKKGESQIQASIEHIVSFPYNIAVVDTTARFGQFFKIDYRTEGKGSLILKEGNELEIIFAKDFFAENATGLPGVEVYLNNGTDPNVAISSGLKVGSVPQNNGEFTMKVPVPSGETAVDIYTKYSHILLICEPFKISFGAAKLN